jgi:hypothetical protein
MTGGIQKETGRLPLGTGGLAIPGIFLLEREFLSLCGKLIAR